VLTVAEDGALHMRAALFSPDGAERCDGEARFASGDSNGPARLAADLLARAVPAIAAISPDRPGRHDPADCHPAATGLRSDSGGGARTRP